MSRGSNTMLAPDQNASSWNVKSRMSRNMRKVKMGMAANRMSLDLMT